MQIYGLTGGTGSGKSEVARRMATHGLPIIDADRVGHELLEPGGRAVDAVVAAFGEGVLTDGVVDRVKLGEMVFGDQAALATLNSIVHPMIGLVIAERCAQLSAEGHCQVVLDAALLAENGKREPWLHGLILVSARPEARLSRLVTLRGMNLDEARRRIDAQTDPEAKRAVADWIIENSSTLEALHARADEVAREIRSQRES